MSYVFHSIYPFSSFFFSFFFFNLCFSPFFFLPFQVFVAAFSKRKQVCPSNRQTLHGSQSNAPNNHVTLSSDTGSLIHTEKFRYIWKRSHFFPSFVVLLTLTFSVKHSQIIHEKTKHNKDKSKNVFVTQFKCII
jgi:hypothetical protein